MKLYRIGLGLFFLLCLTFCSCKETKPTLLNLDFEDVDLQTNKALVWQFYEYGYKIAIDKEFVKSGDYSIKMESSSDYYSSYNGAYAFINYDSIPLNQKIRLTGFIKNTNTNCDSLGLYIRYDVPDYDRWKVLLSKNFIGSHDWQEYSVEILPKGPINSISFGVRLIGPGKIWVDDLKLYIGDKQIFNFPIRNRFKANKDEIKWLKDHSVPIKTVHAESGFNDLEPLKKYLKNARIVALGENTHGTSEIFEMKHRLLEFLSSEMDFTIFSIESGMFNSDSLNNYIQKGEGDPKKLMSTLYPAWNTQEVLDMINWMKKINEQRDKKIQFTGIDMTIIEAPLDHLKTYAKDGDQTIITLVDSIAMLLHSYSNTNNVNEAKQLNRLKIRKCDQILFYLKNAQNQTNNIKKKNELSMIIQNANIIHQYLDYVLIEHKYSVRDRSMAENVAWLLDNNPNAKIVLWAHNEHISKQIGYMGGYLSRKYGDQYYSIGFLTNEGKYTAGLGTEISTENKLIKGEPGSFEYNFNKTGLPCFFFDLKSINKNDQNSLWLDQKLNLRTIGADATENQFVPTVLSKKFDGIIFINSTTPAKTFLPTNVKIKHFYNND